MLSYLEVLKANKQFKAAASSYLPLEVLVLNNITANGIKECVEYQNFNSGIEISLSFGDYDTIVQNAQEWPTEHKVVLVFWELANTIHGLEYKIDALSEQHIQDLETKIQTELQLTFEALKTAKLVVMNQFSALAFSYLNTEYTALEQLADRLNSFCKQIAPPNVKWLNIDKCIAHHGVEATIDYKGFLKNRVLYKHAFNWEYARLLQPYLNAVQGKIKKLLALDCDNTLWAGILGEDGPKGIQMNENTYAGQPFAAAQYRAMALAKKGVLLALASKNNAEDVDEVLDKHEFIQLSNNELVAKKVDWNTKVENLRTLANELNLGIDSFVFVDDSNFEVQLMRDQNPGVLTWQVPNNAAQYYQMQAEWSNFFVQLNRTAEDSKKLEQYKELANRAAAQAKFADFESFLESLELKLTIYKDAHEQIARMAQMTQKTNQFNLTTKRYSEAQIAQFVHDASQTCFTFKVQDKFGDSGITGLCIATKTTQSAATLDTLLMSCRVLGRKIEFQFIQTVLESLFAEVEIVEAHFSATAKNAQVANFYEECGFTCIVNEENTKTYRIEKATFEANKKNYSFIEVSTIE